MADRIDIELIPKVTAAAMAALKGQLGGLLSAGGGVVSQVGSLLGMGKGAGVVGGAMAAVGSAITTITEGVKELVQTVANFAKYASPAAYEQFNFALQDLYAVIGRLLVPVLRVITELVKIWADFLLTASPDLGEINSLMAELQPMLKALRSVLAELAPLIRDITTAYIQQFRYLTILFNNLLGFLGLTGEGLRSATGLGGRPAAFRGIEEYGRNIRLATAQAPGAFKSPEEKTASFVEKIWTLLEQKYGKPQTDHLRQLVDTGLQGFRLAGFPVPPGI